MTSEQRLELLRPLESLGSTAHIALVTAGWRVSSAPIRRLPARVIVPSVCPS